MYQATSAFSFVCLFLLLLLFFFKQGKLLNYVPLPSQRSWWDCYATRENLEFSFTSSQTSCGGMCGQAVNTSNSGSGGPGSSLARRVVSLDKELKSTLSPFTQVYKCVPATYCWGVTLRWTSILSKGGVAILLGMFHSKESGMLSCRLGLWL